MSQPSRTRSVLSAFGSLKITVAGLFLLLILTVWGTLYQVDHGLYLAQERFYQSTWFWIGGVFPFPGAQLVMAVLFVNLIASMLVVTFYRNRINWGLIVTHFGLLLMLAAGAITFYSGKNAQLSLEEGAGSNVAISFGEWELAILSPSAERGRQPVMALDASALRRGRVIPLPDGARSIRVETYHRNTLAHRDSVENPPVNRSGLTVLESRPLNKEPGQDLPGLEFTLLEEGREPKRFLLWGGDARPTPLDPGGREWIGLRRLRVPLPATLTLVDFKRELYQGSGIAKSYSSQVLVDAGDGLERKVLISMNKPLRIHDFTFYQSSFSSAPGGREISTFSVVQNYGRLMPYVATGATVIGMTFYYTAMLFGRLRRNGNEEKAR